VLGEIGQLFFLRRRKKGVSSRLERGEKRTCARRTGDKAKGGGSKFGREVKSEKERTRLG